MKPRLIVEQKITVFTNKYTIFEATEAGEKGDVIAFAQQKRLAFKEKVTFYNNPQKETPIFTFRAEKVLDVHGRYLVEDMNSGFLGAFRKEFKKSLLRSSWKLINADNQETFNIAENNLVLALIRRFGGFIPFIGELIDILVRFFRYHFTVKDGQNEVGLYRKTTLFRDHYLLSLTDEAYEQHDWRVLAALAVGLDALQSR